MKTTAVKAATEAGAPTGGKASREAAMVKTAESRMATRPARKPVLRYALCMIGAVRVVMGVIARAMDVVCGSMEVVTIGKSCAVRDVGPVVVDDGAVPPIAAPVVPSPSEASEKVDSEAEAERDAGPRDIESRIGVPVRPHRDGRSKN